ncbi:hypothetical protein TL16_g04375 [Triparma laevis f. inornata]|uniref:CBS domain-containing protein n=1 Tax=Triparma laevis f. inornata TaxID=1714386 RepID=A0A9W7AEB7_9STRA|nr:hypothetical protein TL16_g04375 [Triparma laevis f. inornata]
MEGSIGNASVVAGDVNDVNGLPKTPSQSILNEKHVIRGAGKEAINEFLSTHSAFEVIRTSGKVVVFDVRISVQLAFYALVEHDMQAAPLWDASIREFVGLMTVTDFISILRLYSLSSLPISDLASKSISDIISTPVGVPGLGKLKHEVFDAADVSATLGQCCRLMHGKGIDFLPVILPSDACITYTIILEYLVTHFREQRRLFDDTIYDLGIGTYENIVTVKGEQKLSEVLALIERRGLSAVPVVDDKGVVVNVYSASDITFLATATDADSAVGNLSLSLGEILSQQRSDVSTHDRLYTCGRNSTLQSVFEIFASVKFNRLICVDEGGRCNGIMSARDLVSYFVG